MIGTVISTVKSFYSASHYEWAACERGGICLSYMFSLVASICIGLSIYMFITMPNAMPDLSRPINTGNGIMDMFMSSGQILAMFLGLDSSNLLFYLLFVVVISLTISLSIINAAIVISIIGMPVNYGLKAKLTFDQLLRVTVYALVPPTIIIIAIALIAKIHDPTSIKILYGIFIALYEVYAIICAKRYIDF